MPAVEFIATSSNITLADGSKAGIERRASGETWVRDYGPGGCAAKESLKNSIAPCLKRFGLREINGLP